MPTYEYGCKACGHQFEKDQRITEPPVKTCPACKKRQVQRLISGGSFILKGGGWYADAYSGPSNARGESTASPPSESASGSSSSESSSSSSSSESSSSSSSSESSSSSSSSESSSSSDD